MCFCDVICNSFLDRRSSLMWLLNRSVVIAPVKVEQIKKTRRRKNYKKKNRNEEVKKRKAPSNWFLEDHNHH